MIEFGADRALTLVDISRSLKRLGGPHVASNLGARPTKRWSAIQSTYITELVPALLILRTFESLHVHISTLIFRTFTMVVVAIAGGTGGVGRTVLDAIAEAGEHKAIVLSRTVSSSMLSL